MAVIIHCPSFLVAKALSRLDSFYRLWEWYQSSGIPPLRRHAIAATGTAMFDKKNQPTDNPALDRCGGWWSSCKIRGNTRRFGGSMGASLIATSR